MTDLGNVRLDALAGALERSTRGGFEAAGAPQDEDSRFRSELAQALARLGGGATPNVFGSVDDRLVSLAQAWLGRHGGEHGAEIVPAGDGREAKFDNLDPGWIWSLREWIQKLFKHAFVAPAPEPETIAERWRIGIVGDWGTGLYGAPVSAASLAKAKPDALLHLGDIYYAGDDAEVRERFLAHWPVLPGVRHRALNGNHEMYTGGKAYFDVLLADPRFAQPASCFAQRNAHWLLIHLDTAYEDHDLYGSQAAWVQHLAAQWPDHRVLLFSHHQPFSAFESQGPKLVHKLSPLLMSGRVAAWYWGHEHSCLRYDPHPTWGLHGRCIGHGGFPYFRFLDNGRPEVDHAWVPFAARGYRPGGVALDGRNPYVRGFENDYGPNGHLLLELDGRALHETYCAPDGTVLAEFDIAPDRR